MGRHEDGPRGDQARHQAQPDAGAGAGQPRARALRRANGAREPAADAPAAAPADRRGRRAGALQPRARLPAEGLHAEALREYRLALEAGEDRRLTPPGDGRGAPAAARAAGGARAVRRAGPRVSPTRPSSGTSAACACTRRAAGPRRSRPTSGPWRSIRGYQLAWNNLGVVAGGRARATAAIAAFRRALDGDRPLFAARLNLGLLFLQRRQLRAALEEYQRRARASSRAAPSPGTAWASCSWSSGGSRMRATRSAARWTPTRRMAGAHYNLSFVLSQLGDFDGALRETRRALELEPLYVPQKFSLTIDLQYEDPDDRDRARAHGRGGRRAARGRVRVRSAGARPAVRRARAGRAAGRRATARRATRSTSRATTSPRDCSTSPRPS